MYTRTSNLVNRKFREFYPPMLVMSLALALGIVGNSIIVGNMLGPRGLATTNLIFPFIQCLIMVCGLFGIGGATIVARAKGERNNAKANIVLSLSLAAIVFFGVVCLLLRFYALDNIAAFLVKDKDLYELTRDYLSVYLFGAPVFMLVLSMVYFIRTDGLPKLASNILLTANVAILLLDLLFLGPLQMGIKGVALATVLGYTLGGLFVIAYVKSSQRTLQPQKFKLRDTALYGDMTSAGISSALGQILMLLKLIFINRLVMEIGGTAGLVAFSVCLSMLSISSVLLNGSAQAMIPMAGNFYGERDSAGIIYTVRQALRFLFVACTILMILIFIFPVQVMALYGVTNPEAVGIGIGALRIFAVLQILFSFAFFMMYYTQTIKRPKFSAAICIVEGYIVIVPLAWFLGHKFGLSGVWWAFFITEVVTAIFILLGSYIMARRSKGKTAPFFMVDKPQPGIPELDVSISAKAEDAAGLSQQVIIFCSSHNIDNIKATQLGVMVEEMAMSIAAINPKKNHVYIDIRVKIFADEILVAFRDDGTPFNVGSHVTAAPAEFHIDSVDMLRKLSSHIEYSRAIGMNCTSLHLAL